MESEHLPVLESEDRNAIECILKEISSESFENYSASTIILRRVEFFCLKYQEQPQLLDPYLSGILTPLLQELRGQTLAADSDMKRVQIVCGTIKFVSKVRGQKVVAQFFPNSPADLEPAVGFLQKCAENDKLHPARASNDEDTPSYWESCSVLLQWLSILVLIPFDLSSVDSEMSNPETSSTGSPLVLRLVETAWRFLESPAAARDMAVLLLARLLTRPDLTKPLHKFVEEACEMVSEWVEMKSTRATSGKLDFLIPGLVATLAAIFKVGGRDILAREKSRIWSQVCLPLGATPLADRNPLLRRLRVKLIQRLGLAEMMPRVATWRYQRGSRSLEDNLKRQASKGPSGAQASAGESPEVPSDAEFEVPEILESYIQELLEGIRDKDSGVRWTSAKGLGRLTSRLPLTMADQVVEAIVGLCDAAEGEGAWHGACLAIAELTLRGALLPSRLSSVVPIVIQCLYYDVPRGAHSVGSFVRDSAAYVAWSFFRAYSPAVMKPHVCQLATNLLTVACYDREVVCRRAASASFQECAGRHSQSLPFPVATALEVVAECDFVTVGPTPAAFLLVGPAVARLAGRQTAGSMEQHILERKIGHWCRGTRQLAGEALSRFVPMDPTHFSEAVFDQLLSDTCHADLAKRHGAVFAVGKLLDALNGLKQRISCSRQVAMVSLVCGLSIRGKGAEMMRVAASGLVKAMAESGMAIGEQEQERILQSLEEHLRDPLPACQESAAEALGAFSRAFCQPTTWKHLARVPGRLLSTLRLPSESPEVRRGSALGLGTLPEALVLPLFSHVIGTLCWVIRPKSGSGSDPETRVNACKSLPLCCFHLKAGLPLDQPSITVDQLASPQYPAASPWFTAESPPGLNLPSSAVLESAVLSTLLEAMWDYTTDKRGDVGSLVREAAMDCLLKLSPLLQPSSGGSEPSLWGELVANLARLAVEKIDRTRGKAGAALQSIVWGHEDPENLRKIPSLESLRQAIPGDDSVDWADPSSSYPHLLSLLLLPAYRRQLLEGLLCALGGLSRGLQDQATKSVVGFLGQLGSSAADLERQLAEDLLKIVGENVHVDRIVLPGLKSLDILLSNSVFSCLRKDLESDFGSRVIKLVEIELSNPPCRDVSKLLSCVDLVCHLLTWERPASCLALSWLLRTVGSRFPKVRQYCAEQLYLQILSIDAEEGEESNGLVEAMEILSETEWNGSIVDLRDKRTRLKLVLSSLLS